MSMGACPVFFRSTFFFSRLTMLFELRQCHRFASAFGSLGDWCPKNTDSSAQRDKLQCQGTDYDPGHRRPDSSRIPNVKEKHFMMKC